MNKLDVSFEAQKMLDQIERLAAESLFLQEIEPQCRECNDVHWVRIEIIESKRKSGSADHYMQPCSQCYPDRYRMMVTENHQEHVDIGGCFTCRKYVRPWEVKK